MFVECSTPFGITEVGTSFRRVGVPRGRECSTPFGITEVGTRLRCEYLPSAFGAQRLSASQRSAPARRESPWFAWCACSTPFGITEVGTPLASRASARPSCAQRLSASQRSAHSLGVFPRTARLCSTPFGITEVGTEEAVMGEANPVRCSTPFGITEVGTPGKTLPLRGSGCAQRLSASQRSARFVRVERDRHGAKCSTPFGITEVGTQTAWWTTSATISCSTPFGITEVGTEERLQIGAKEPVLNAFRHHRGRHHQDGFGSSVSECAQRLSASQRSARGGRHRRRRHEQVLNAFRHHRGRHWSAPRSHGLAWLVLNAFRHHRGRHKAECFRNVSFTVCSTPFGITEVGTGVETVGLYRG